MLNLLVGRRTKNTMRQGHKVALVLDIRRDLDLQCSTVSGNYLPIEAVSKNGTGSGGAVQRKGYDPTGPTHHAPAMQVLVHAIQSRCVEKKANMSSNPAQHCDTLRVWILIAKAENFRRRGALSFTRTL